MKLQGSYPCFLIFKGILSITREGYRWKVDQTCNLIAIYYAINMVSNTEFSQEVLQSRCCSKEWIKLEEKNELESIKIKSRIRVTEVPHSFESQEKKISNITRIFIKIFHIFFFAHVIMCIYLHALSYVDFSS